MSAMDEVFTIGGCVCSSSKGIPEKEYQFDIELFDEIIPEVRRSPSGSLVPLPH